MKKKNDSIPNLILGTVQLGQKYGINNTFGQPSVSEAHNILNYAFDNGVTILDTAAAYGESEEIIGQYHRNSFNRFHICTKLPISNLNIDNLELAIELSLKKLYVDQIYTLFLHRFEQIKENWLTESLLKLKDDGVIENIGVSLYSPDELEIINLEYSTVFDVVQIPLNILDNFRWKKAVVESRSKGIRVFTRSVFLQGLLYKDVSDEFVKSLGASKYIFEIQNMAKIKSVNLTKLMLDYNKGYGVDGILIGCETLEQLKINVENYNQNCSFTIDDYNYIEKLTSNIDDMIVDPRKWN